MDYQTKFKITDIIMKIICVFFLISVLFTFGAKYQYEDAYRRSKGIYNERR